jgi:Xaa-Pro aminopeptidase
MSRDLLYKATTADEIQAMETANLKEALQLATCFQGIQEKASSGAAVTERELEFAPTDSRKERAKKVAFGANAANHTHIAGDSQLGSDSCLIDVVAEYDSGAVTHCARSFSAQPGPAEQRSAYTRII